MTLNAPMHGHPEGNPETTMQLTRFWSGYFSETPLCTHAECQGVAVEVDPYFPYLDDNNRCLEHRNYETGCLA